MGCFKTSKTLPEKGIQMPHLNTTCKHFWHLFLRRERLQVVVLTFKCTTVAISDKISSLKNGKILHFSIYNGFLYIDMVTFPVPNKFLKLSIYNPNSQWLIFRLIGTNEWLSINRLSTGFPNHCVVGMKLRLHVTHVHYTGWFPSPPTQVIINDR